MAKSVFEFGCHVGRNLRVIKEVSGCKVAGIDVNKHAIDYGKENNKLSLKVGDHNSLKQMKTNSFDVCITVSALDHVPAIDIALENLVRIAKSWMIMIEPFEYGAEGKLVEYMDKSGKMNPATPYTYIWDYEKRLAALRKKILEFTIDEMPLSGVNLGPYYKLFIVKMR